MYINAQLCLFYLDYCAPPKMSKGEVQQEAEHCNDKKLAAKRVSELSSELYFAVFVKVSVAVRFELNCIFL